MTDVTLVPITSGYNVSKINANFDVIEEAINNDVLNLSGGNNTMLQDLDMNSSQILNLPFPNTPTSPVRLQDLIASASDNTGLVLRADLADTTDVAKGDALVSVVQPFAGAVARTQHQKNLDTVVVADFVVAGNYSQAIQSMADAVGFVRFSRGNHPITANTTIDVPVFFEAGAYITAAAGITVTIRNSVDSQRQWIFRGDGSYSLAHNTSTGQGEIARVAHVSWFGAFPGNSLVDSGPLLQKLTNSMGNTREAYIFFDVGTYFLQTPVVWQRASKVVGAGDRLTNIWVKFLTGDVFSTAGDGCNFHNLQFNCDDFRTSGAYIALLNARSETYDIYMDHGFIGIDMRAFECEAHRTKGLTWSSAAGSRVIRVAADDCLVDTYNYTVNTDNGPEFVVACEVVSGTANRPRVFKGIVKNRLAGSGVGILHNSTGSVQSATVKDLNMVAGNYGVVVRNTGTTSPNISEINGVKSITGSGIVDLVLVENTNTGSIFSTNINNITCQQASGCGIRINRQGAGAIRNVNIGQHDIAAGTGILVTGSTSSNVPDNVNIGSGICHNCTGNGYDITSLVFCGMGLVSRSNTGIGIRLGLGGNHLLVRGISFGNGTEVSDLTGSVIKDISVLN